jgi:hypothetical protein
MILVFFMFTEKKMLYIKEIIEITGGKPLIWHYKNTILHSNIQGHPFPKWIHNKSGSL